MKREILHKELSYKIVGTLYKIHNDLGRFCSERQYCDAIEKEFQKERVPYKREHPVIFEGKKSNKVDFFIDDKIILETKAKSFVTKDDYFQIKRYLNESNLELGLLVNFRKRFLNIRRILNKT